MGAEEQRLAEAAARKVNWQRWGTYLPERQWGTVREDDSNDGNPWEFTYERAREQAYQWGEDGLLGWTDRECRICFSTTLWNGKDDHLKERLFGLTNPQGNHGEDVKELYYYLDATPTHSYAKGLYKYPQGAFPYKQLIEENGKRGYGKPEFELLDTGLFAESRYFDVQIEYAKWNADDVLIRLTVTNCGPEDAELWVVPTITLRNTWSAPTPEDTGDLRPSMRLSEDGSTVEITHGTLGRFGLRCLSEEGETRPQILFTENESGPPADAAPSQQRHPAKDGFDAFLVRGDASHLCEGASGTKAACVLRARIAAGAERTIRCALLSEATLGQQALSAAEFDALVDRRRLEADEFYRDTLPPSFTTEERSVARQGYAGLLWSKQFYFYVGHGATSRPESETPRTEAELKRNAHWSNLFCRDVLSMPDKWEYPWFAAWDSAFQLVVLAKVDPVYAKQQLLLFLREWYMHPDGQLPAYEYKFDDVNPPVHAWAVLRVFEMEALKGKPDYEFLKRAFHKLLINFTWWVNRLDPSGNNVFGGGFLGLDNIGIFDRSALPAEDRLAQADGTAWMGFFCATMLTAAIELAQQDPVYEDIASKFFQHYIAIIDSFNHLGGTGLWSEQDGFFFDKLIAPGEQPRTLNVRSIVGVVPLFALCVLPASKTKRLPAFLKRVKWFRENRPDLAEFIRMAETEDPEYKGAYFISLVQEHRVTRLAERLFDPGEFLSEHGIRSLSRSYLESPFETELAGKTYTVRYTPAEGDSGMFGGNSNWRGPIWFPMNLLLLEALERYARILGESYRLEYPSGAGQKKPLAEIAADLGTRLSSIFLPDSFGRRPCHGREERYAQAGPWKDLVLFYEYFSGDDGRGVGASHQTGWTATVLLCMEAVSRLSSPTPVSSPGEGGDPRRQPA